MSSKRVPATCKNCGVYFEGLLSSGAYPQFCSQDCYNAFRRKPKQIKKRFWSYVEIGAPEECWVWTGGINHDGYGRFSYYRKIQEQKNVIAHRFAYRITKGRIPKGLDVLHTCDLPICVNPDHLFLGDQRDNMVDRDRKNRQAKGERQGSAKLTESEIRAIRNLWRQGQKQQSIADAFGVTQSVISTIVRGAAWRHIKE